MAAPQTPGLDDYQKELRDQGFSEQQINTLIEALDDWFLADDEHIEAAEQAIISAAENIFSGRPDSQERFREISNKITGENTQLIADTTNHNPHEDNSPRGRSKKRLAQTLMNMAINDAIFQASYENAKKYLNTNRSEQTKAAIRVWTDIATDDTAPQEERHAAIKKIQITTQRDLSSSPEHQGLDPETRKRIEDRLAIETFAEGYQRRGLSEEAALQKAQESYEAAIEYYEQNPEKAAILTATIDAEERAAAVLDAANNATPDERDALTAEYKAAIADLNAQRAAMENNLDTPELVDVTKTIIADIAAQKAQLEAKLAEWEQTDAAIEQKLDKEVVTLDIDNGPADFMMGTSTTRIEIYSGTGVDKQGGLITDGDGPESYFRKYPDGTFEPIDPEHFLSNDCATLATQIKESKFDFNTLNEETRAKLAKLGIHTMEDLTTALTPAPFAEDPMSPEYDAALDAAMTAQEQRTTIHTLITNDDGLKIQVSRYAMQSAIQAQLDAGQVFASDVEAELTALHTQQQQQTKAIDTMVASGQTDTAAPAPAPGMSRETLNQKIKRIINESAATGSITPSRLAELAEEYDIPADKIPQVTDELKTSGIKIAGNSPIQIYPNGQRVGALAIMDNTPAGGQTSGAFAQVATAEPQPQGASPAPAYTPTPAPAAGSSMNA